MMDNPYNIPPNQQQSPYYQPQQPYPPNYQPFNMKPDYPETVGQWVLSLFLVSIPIVGIIMLFIWAFGSNASISKSNWAKAMLIWALIAIVISLLFIGVIASMVGSLTGSRSYY